jgi:hypothetical protein
MKLQVSFDLDINLKDQTLTQEEERAMRIVVRDKIRYFTENITFYTPAQDGAIENSFQCKVRNLQIDTEFHN